MTNSAALTLKPSQLAMAISNPGSLGTIDAYISTVNRLPVLSAEQEVKLAQRLRDTDDIDAARELVLSHLRLVVKQPRIFAYTISPRRNIRAIKKAGELEKWIIPWVIKSKS